MHSIDMNRSRIRLAFGMGLAPLLLSGCSDTKILDDAQIDYKSPDSQQNSPLAVPPDLISSLEPQSDAETYSEYLISALPEKKNVAPQVADVNYVRKGNFRWILVQLPPHEVWPVVKSFWEDLGFDLVINSPETGIMETNWLQNRSKLIGTGLTGTIDKLIDRLQDTGERDKYRTRIERGATPDVTEVYITHRGIQEVFTRNGYEFVRIPNDISLEVELLRRIMLRFAGEKEKIRRRIVDAEQEATKPLDYGDDWLFIESEPETAWRRVSIALDRSGFTVVERDRDAGMFLIRYSDERIAEESGGILSGIAGFFSGDTAVPATSISIVLEPAEDGTRLSVRPHEGSDVIEAAPDIIALVAENI